MDCVRWLLGLGFWVQGFRCFPWLAVSFFLKDGLRVAPAAMQLLQNSANLPMVAKPIFGLLSDAHQRRIPYLAAGALLQAISWLVISLLPKSSMTLTTVATLLLLSNLGASIAEVANDAIVAEAGKQLQSASGSGQLQSFVWMASSAAGAIGNLLGGVMIDRFSPRTMFLLFGFLAVLQFLATICVPESYLKFQQKHSQQPKSSSIHLQISELSTALRKPGIFYAILWFAASYAVVPLLLGTMFFYQTQFLKLESSVIGFSKVFGQAALLVWSMAYNKKLKSFSIRRILAALQVTHALLMLSDFLFVKGFYKDIGVPDAIYVVVFSGFLEAMLFFKILPFSVLMGQICPSGCEGSIMAFSMSAASLAAIFSGYFGVALAAIVGVTDNEFSDLPTGILVQAMCTVLPLLCLSWIPETADLDKKKD